MGRKQSNQAKEEAALRGEKLEDQPRLTALLDTSGVAGVHEDAWLMSWQNFERDFLSPNSLNVGVTNAMDSMISALQHKPISSNFVAPVWEMWPEAYDEASYRAELAKHSDAPLPSDLRSSLHSILTGFADANRMQDEVRQPATCCGLINDKDSEFGRSVSSHKSQASRLWNQTVPAIAFAVKHVQEQCALPLESTKTVTPKKTPAAKKRASSRRSAKSSRRSKTQDADAVQTDRESLRADVRADDKTGRMDDDENTESESESDDVNLRLNDDEETAQATDHGLLDSLKRSRPTREERKAKRRRKMTTPLPPPPLSVEAPTPEAASGEAASVAVSVPASAVLAEDDDGDASYDASLDPDLQQEEAAVPTSRSRRRSGRSTGASKKRSRGKRSAKSEVKVPQTRLLNSEEEICEFVRYSGRRLYLPEHWRVEETMTHNSTYKRYMPPGSGKAVRNVKEIRVMLLEQLKSGEIKLPLKVVMPPVVRVDRHTLVPDAETKRLQLAEKGQEDETEAIRKANAEPTTLVGRSIWVYDSFLTRWVEMDVIGVHVRVGDAPRFIMKAHSSQGREELMRLDNRAVRLTMTPKQGKTKEPPLPIPQGESAFGDCELRKLRERVKQLEQQQSKDDCDKEESTVPESVSVSAEASAGAEADDVAKDATSADTKKASTSATSEEQSDPADTTADTTAVTTADTNTAEETVLVAAAATDSA